MELLMFARAGGRTVAQALETEALVRRTLAGDTAAFEQIVLGTSGRIMTCVASAPAQRTDGLRMRRQEVFLRAFKYIHRPIFRRPIEPWLMRNDRECLPGYRAEETAPSQHLFPKSPPSMRTPKDNPETPMQVSRGNSSARCSGGHWTELPEK